MNRLIFVNSISFFDSSNNLKMSSLLSFQFADLILQDYNIDFKFIRSFKKYDSEIAIILYPYIRNNDTKLETVKSINIDLCSVSEDKLKAKAIQFTSMLPVFTLLIKDNIDTYISWKYLHQLLCMCGFIDIVKLLVENGLQIPRDGSLEENASLSSNHELIRYLFEKGTYKNIDLSYVCDSYETTKFFLDQNIRTNIDEALVVACDNNDADIVKLLLEHGADAKGGIYCAPEEPLQIAIEHKNKEIIKLLRKHGASFTKAKVLDLTTRCLYYLFKDVEKE